MADSNKLENGKARYPAARAMSHNARAATLPELVFVLALLSLLLGTSVPTVSRLAQRHHAKAELMELLRTLNNASTTAAFRGCELEFLAAANGYILRTKPSKQIISSHSDLHIIFEDKPDSAGSLITFYPTGTATPASLHLIYRGQPCLITVALRGRIQSSCE